MKKVINPGRVDVRGNGKTTPLFCKIEITDGKLSISGVEGPLASGNAVGGCGQIDMGYYHTNEAENDKRYKKGHLTRIAEYTAGWSAPMFQKFLSVWHRWHLNDMRSACEHQRALGWKYEEHHDKKTFQGEACPTCGYKIGSACLKEELPQDVIDFLVSLPDSTTTPKWV